MILWSMTSFPIVQVAAAPFVGPIQRDEYMMLYILSFLMSYLHVLRYRLSFSFAAENSMDYL